MSILKKLSIFVHNNAAPHSPGGDSVRDVDKENLAAAALMVEVAAYDGQISSCERGRILNLLEHRLGLSRDEAIELFVEALAAQTDSTHILGFTREIKDHFDETGRENILELMWEVVFADGKEDDYESNLLRRVSGLLYISDKRNGQIKKKVKARRQ
ncbi:MAG: TerB family tellurite resistance protein [Alphaproteobacteria bacterium]|nr:TerB family tellurite resistance protein [Alphaproteobacteria bacterium]